MPTTSQQLKDFAAMAVDAPVWTPDLQGQLMDLIREPAMTLMGQTIPPNDITKAMDNIYRCAPRGWQRNSQELAPLPSNPTKSQGAVAGFTKWTPDPQLGMALTPNHELWCGKVCATLAVAMVAATAVVWAEILREAGR